MKGCCGAPKNHAAQLACAVCLIFFCVKMMIAERLMTLITETLSLSESVWFDVCNKGHVQTVQLRCVSSF